MPSETMMTRTPLRSAAKVVLGVHLVTPPKNCLDELPELEAFFFGDRRRLLGRAPIQSGVGEINCQLTGTRTVTVILGVAGMHPQTVFANGNLPSVSAESRDLKLLEIPSGWWNLFLKGETLSIYGRVERIFGENELPVGEGTVEIFKVDPYQWIHARTDAEISQFRDQLLAHPMCRGFRSPGGFIPTEILAGLEGNALRDNLIQYRKEFLPIFRAALPEWWYRVEPFGEMEIFPNGTFRGIAGWQFRAEEGNHLYFRVRQHIHGRERYISKAPIQTGTWWNYSGEEVLLRTSHPEAICREDVSYTQGSQIVFRGIGLDVFSRDENEPGMIAEGEFSGLYRGSDGSLAPYGGTLHLLLDVDLEALRESGVEFYRISYQRGRDPEGPGNWTPITTPVFRHHRVVREIDGKEIKATPAISLVPEYTEIPDALAGEEGILRFPEPEYDFVITAPEDRAWAIWDTTSIPANGESQEDAAGPYTLRIELFDSSGQEVTETIPIFRAVTPFPVNGNSIAECKRPEFCVYVDNRAMVSRIHPTAPYGEIVAASGCGFQSARVGSGLANGIQAFHPGGFHGGWRFLLERGTAGERAACIQGNRAAGDASTVFPIPEEAFFPKAANHVKIQERIPAPAAIQPRINTFLATLEAFGNTRNGYGILPEIHRKSVMAFSVMEFDPVSSGNNPGINQSVIPIRAAAPITKI